MMDQLIERFMDQLEEAVEIGRNAKVQPLSKEVHHIYVAGLGGSGIGADFVASFIQGECKVPYIVRKGYSVPAYVGPNTLAIASSYSGNTEETLISYDLIREAGARIICIASGGKLVEKAKQDQYDYVQVPANWPSPRACLGYSLTVQLWVLQHLGFISDRYVNEIQSSIKLLRHESDDIKRRAEEIAHRLYQRIPVIYIEDRMEPVAVRLRQQINENSKALCWHHVVPEMNHNELVGWREKNESLTVVYLRNEDDYARNKFRMDINKGIISKYAHDIIEINSRGNTMIERSLYLVHLGDWVSWYLAQLRGVDALEVKVIDYLKGELSKV
ncbi:MAG TPA: bifunctional phosphoglucose/phosphomannose isomerase [Saprospiraceae bacterium]|nr:bifunctional phosphoglucose/phosphomannose isomerase [Saprospiraceae bacterium]